MIIHEGPDVRIRWLRPADAADLLAVTKDAEVVRYVGDGSVLTAAQVETWITRSQANYARFGFGTYALADPADDRLFGWGGFVPPVREPVPELIYGFARDRWGRGLGRVVAAALVAHAKDLGMPCILATIDEANAPSCRIVERLGFRLDAVVVEDGVPVRRYLLNP